MALAQILKIYKPFYRFVGLDPTISKDIAVFVFFLIHSCTCIRKGPRSTMVRFEQLYLLLRSYDCIVQESRWYRILHQNHIFSMSRIFACLSSSQGSGNYPSSQLQHSVTLVVISCFEFVISMNIHLLEREFYDLQFWSLCIFKKSA